jgi:hypothetical protein
MLAVALAFGILAVGCATGDEWTPVTRLVDVDGRWEATVKVVDTGVSTTETKTTLVVAARVPSYIQTVVTKVTYDVAADYEAERAKPYNPDVVLDDAAKTVTTTKVTKSASGASATAVLNAFAADLLSPDGKLLLRGSISTVLTKQ